MSGSEAAGEMASGSFANEEEMPTSTTDSELAGNENLDKEVDFELPKSPRGAKRPVSEDEASSDVKRLAFDDNHDPTVSNSAEEIAKACEKDNDIASDEAVKKTPPEVVIEISDDSSDSDICAVDSYQATAEELKKIRGDNYSSSSDYSSDSSSSSGEDDSIVLGPHRPRSIVSARRAQLNPRASRTDVPVLNEDITSTDSTDKLSAHWAQCEDLRDDNFTFTNEPFKVCLLHNLVSNAELLNNIVDDINTLDWSRKKMDLYEFHQTTDLANLTWQRGIRGIYDLLKNELMPWVSRVTGVRLTHASASCSLYGPGDHLLVHDDMLADRRVAFVLYLAPWNIPRRRTKENGHTEEQAGWTECMGGALELFSVDEDRQPSKAVRSILPRNNTLVFFQVSPLSFHQVTEVRSLEYPRLSINGWFHGPGEQEQAETAHSPPVASIPHTEVALLSAWLTPQYLAPRTRLQIQSQMEKASEISLQNYLQPDKYSGVCEALSSPDVQWEEAGPANLCRYEALNLGSLETLDRTHPLREFVWLFTSNNFYRFLHDCTDLTVQSHFAMQVQRWRRHCYTVLPPKEHYAQNQLDVVMYLGLPERNFNGGVITYVAPEDESAPPLVSLEPCNNALNLVFADDKTARFTKHVSALTLKEDECFYIVTCSYKEGLP